MGISNLDGITLMRCTEDTPAFKENSTNTSITATAKKHTRESHVTEQGN